MSIYIAGVQTEIRFFRFPDCHWQSEVNWFGENIFIVEIWKNGRGDVSDFNPKFSILYVRILI